MCASVCPSDALWFGTRELFERTRTGILINEYLFGDQPVKTKAFSVVREAGPLDILSGRETGTWQDDPFGLTEQTNE